MTITDKIMDLSVLWKQAAVTFPYFSRLAQDWDALYREYLDKVMQTKSDREYFLLLAEFLNQLADGHTDLQFPKRILDEVGYLPFQLTYLSGKYYVNFEEVIEINNEPIQSILDQAFRYVYHVGNCAKLQRILPFFLKRVGNVLKTQGGTYPFDLCKERPQMVRPQSVEINEIGDILHVRLNDFQYAKAAEEVEKALGGKRAVILDIRENIGGMTKLGADVAKLFISGQFHACKKWTQSQRAIDRSVASQIMLMPQSENDEDLQWSKRVWEHMLYQEYEDTYGADEHRAVFDGPCVLLTSRNTVSAAEDFAAMFRTNHRGVLIGAPTFGTTGTPLLQSLSEGSARICSVGYRLLDGTEFIGCGIIPDILVEPKIDDLKTGKDTVLEYALDYLR